MKIVDHYRRARAAADTVAERDIVWRTYARAVIEEFQDRQRRDRKIGAPLIFWRRARCDQHLAVRFKPYWASIPLADLQELWISLERVRQKCKG